MDANTIYKQSDRLMQDFLNKAGGDIEEAFGASCIALAIMLLKFDSSEIEEATNEAAQALIVKFEEGEE